MAPDIIFVVVNGIAFAAWVLLAVFPRRRLVRDTTGFVVPALLAAVYVAIVAAEWANSEGGFGSLTAVAALFANPWLLLAGWTHYLAFDLFVGGWEVRDAQSRGIPHALVIPCLLLTFLFGPAGWILYLALRSQRAGARSGSAAR
jgi:hypothetical protein